MALNLPLSITYDDLYDGIGHWNPVELGRPVPGIEDVEFAYRDSNVAYIFTITHLTDEAIERVHLLQSMGFSLVSLPKDLPRPFRRKRVPYGKFMIFPEGEVTCGGKKLSETEDRDFLLADTIATKTADAVVELILKSRTA